MPFLGRIYIARCPWYFGDFRNIFRPNIGEDTGVDFWGAGGRYPSGLTLKDRNMSDPLGFLASNAHLAQSVLKKYF